MCFRLGGRISHILGCLDQETQAWFYDIPQTRAVIGYDAGSSEGSLSWLSTNLDLEHPADLDSSANQVPIECLVKWMLHSPSGSLDKLVVYSYTSIFVSKLIAVQDFKQLQ